jgi:hypothetical protein
MEKKLFVEIIICLAKDRTLFRYARNGYALMLLSRYAGKRNIIADLRRSHFGNLLQLGKGKIYSHTFETGSHLNVEVRS